MSARVTIRDVAERAGCGIATVSRVLNESGPASADVRVRVLAAAEELGFQFNELGRSLQSQRSRTLAVLVPSFTNPVFSMAIEGIQRAAAAAGYQILLACANYDEAHELEAIGTLIGKQVDGAILTVANPDDSLTIDALRQHGVPYCLMFNQPRTARPSVGVDNIAAARTVGNVLLRAGHAQTAFIAVKFQTSERSRLRYEGLCAAFASAGQPEPVLLQVDYQPEELEQRLAVLFRDHPQVSALFASNDMLGLTVMRTLRRLGRSVPDDISVVGFDGIAVAEMIEPSLATVATPSGEMGSEAARRVIEAIGQGGAPRPRTIFLPFEFRSGGSLGVRGTEMPADKRQLARRTAFSNAQAAKQVK